MQIIIHNRFQNPPYLISPNFPPKELDSLKEMLYNENIKYTLIYNEKERLEYEQLSQRHN
jgi:hypothetical protein